jgi:hypothetical protein
MRKIGTRAMKVAAMEEYRIDENHSAVKINWAADYRRPKDGKEISIEFAETYLLQFLDGQAQVFAYVAGDQQKVLKENGLAG